MSLKQTEKAFAQILKKAGYHTGYVGKWHISSPKPKDAGFDFVTYFMGNGPHYDRKVIEHGKRKLAKGFIEDYLADQAIKFIESSAKTRKPFLLHVGTQIPHMNHRYRWPASSESLALYKQSDMPVPKNWQDDLEEKPSYLKTGRHRVRGREYGYEDKTAIQKHFRSYFASITDMDRALGKLLAALDRLGLSDNTFIILMGDNGWFMGEHGFTSKVLPYEESIRVPFIVSGPDLKGTVCDELILNADIAPTFLDIAGIPVPDNMHGRSLVPLLNGETVDWRQSILYEALEPELGSWPLVAARTRRWKYIQTFHPENRSKLVFEELYDLEKDLGELNNLASSPSHSDVLKELKAELARLRKCIR